MKNFKSDKACTACGLSGDGFVCLHHLYTRKAYPKLENESWNLLPLCLGCHNQIHAKGLSHMVYKYPRIELWLLRNDWEYDKFLRKWRHNIEN